MWTRLHLNKLSIYLLFCDLTRKHLILFSDTKPVINNLPQTILVPENLSTGSQLFDVDVSDPDPFDTTTYIMIVEPVSATPLFSLIPYSTYSVRIVEIIAVSFKPNA